MNVSQSTTGVWEPLSELPTQPNTLPNAGPADRPAPLSLETLMPTSDRPAWDQFCEITTGWLINAHSPTEERAVWQMKLRARRLYDHARDPEAMACRLLQIVTKTQHQQAA